MATIRDVARLAGVAPITVSRVINKAGYISDDTRLRVEAAIAELRYIPNSLSRSLRSKKTNMVALIVSDITNPFWTTVTRGVEDACSEHKLHVILCNTDENEEKLGEYVDLLRQKQMDGFIVVPTGESVTLLQSLQNQGVPLVVLDRVLPNLHADTVRCDSELGSYELTNYLLGLGHRRIAMLSGSHFISTGHDRIMGYKRALQEAGIPIDDTLISYGDFKTESGYERTLQIMHDSTNRPTALFAGSNFIALGVIKALDEMGLRIPDDISVVSFDDLPDVFRPFLTVIAQGPYDLGYQAAQLLLERLASPDEVIEPREILLPLQILIRQSCAPLHEVSGS
jgi:LacI family transcriptional regulator